MSLRRGELKPARDLKAVFGDIRNYLAGNATGMTRDEALASELINLLLCKMFDEGARGPSEAVAFRVDEGEGPAAARRRIERLFAEVKAQHADIYSGDEKLSLDTKSLVYVVRKLQAVSLSAASREAIGEAFEVFIGPALRGGEGQFFTPKNVVDMTVAILDPKGGERIIDPACGSGGFLTVALSRAMAKGGKAPPAIRGIDKDRFLAKVTKASLALMGGGKGCIFCENSLDDPDNWAPETRAGAALGSFDVVMTNPPFGAKIPISERRLLAQYGLGHGWRRPDGKKWVRSGELLDSQPPQILFIERCLQLLRPGGRMGIVLPDGIFGNTSDGYIREFMLAHSRILAVIDVPSETFQPGTATKTSVLFLQKAKASNENYPIFMSIVNECGHDRRGRENTRDEMPAAARKYRERSKIRGYERLGFIVGSGEVRDSGELILTPKYYDPELRARLRRLGRDGGHELRSVGELVKAGILGIRRGNEVGSKLYGLGSIPFIRTSDISNWEIRINPETGIDEETYNRYSAVQDLRPEDILFVNDGGRMVGEAAILTPHDGKVLIQSHVRRIRVLKRESMDPYLLLYLLKLPVVRDQIESKRFVQATIPSLGNRLLEVVLPIPKSPKKREELASRTRRLVLERAGLRKEISDYTGRDP